MCGISGYIYRDSARPGRVEELKPMLDVIAHRGPDDWGSHVDGPLAFGMRRLSIIDLSTGHQPIHNEDKTVWTVFNGELYNFVELRPMLEAKGHTFYTNTDTEVIVHLWEEFGPDFVEHLRGMFGIALWDSRTKQLMLVRDRLGIKPLYYAERAEGLFFGSELKSLLAHPLIESTPDYSAIRAFLELQYVPGAMSAVKDVKKLKPGNALLWNNGTVRTWEYWDAPLEPEHNGRSYEEFREELESELMKAVKMRLISDVPLGVFLSGGVDSSTVAALMARQMNEPVKTFSIGFDHEKFDELKYARMIADKYETDHHEEVVHADAIELLPKLVWHYDEPFADPSSIPTYYVSRMARKHVTVVLSGDGGDELFSGYGRYAEMKRYQTFSNLLGPMRGPMFRAASHLPFSIRKRGLLHRLSLPLEDMYQSRMSFFTGPWIDALAPHSPIGGSRAGTTTDWSEHWSRVQSSPFLGQLGYIDTKTYLPDDILTKVDRASMAVSLESRVPILDHKIVELAARMPFDHKMRGNVGKYILKDMIRPHVPEGFLERPKMGFGVPLVEWFRNELRDYVRDRLLSSKAKQRGIFDADVVENLIDLHQSEQLDIAHMLWALLILEEWFCQFVDHEQQPTN